MDPSTPELPIVVHVDEDEDCHDVVTRALAGRFETVWIKDVHRGLDEIERQQPAVILTELTLGTSDGYQVIRSIKASPNLQSIPVVVLSARILRDEARRAREAGAAAFIEKPFDLNHLRETLARLATAVPADDGPDGEDGVVGPVA